VGALRSQTLHGSRDREVHQAGEEDTTMPRTVSQRKKTVTQSDSLEERLVKVIKDGLKAYNIRAKVEVQPTTIANTFDIWVISKDFEGSLLSDRDALVWQIMKEQFDNAELMRVLMIFAITPREARGEWD
jgi:stress-induced morphogen